MTKRPIKYTSRDFESIKDSLVNYAKRYYPTTFKDFNQASFGALMLDLVAYVGDQLSFYADYQANESFLDSALEYENIMRIATQLGFKPPGAAVSTGMCSFYINVPAATSISGPDPAYLPILEGGATLTSDGGAVYTLLEDVDFSDSSNEITVSQVDSDTGVPTFFAIKAYGTVISGQEFIKTETIGDYRRFLRIPLNEPNVSEIVSIFDTQGHEYFEVPNLSQDVVLGEISNRADDRDKVKYILKTIPVPRRFVVEFDSSGDAFIQFGYGSADNLTGDLIADPSDVVLEVTGRKYISDTTFDPSNLIKTDKFGVTPSDTNLTITYRANTSETVNAQVGAINDVSSYDFSFKNSAGLSTSMINTVRGSLEVENETPILGDTSILMPDEIRTRAYGSYASQNRAVTRSDYVNMVYRMPSKFGRIKRVNVVQDQYSLKRNLNLYVLSENVGGDFAAANSTLKTNLKLWLNNFRMLNDTIDILDGKIINYGINFEVIADLGVNRFDLLQACVEKIKEKVLMVKKEIGESVYLSDIYRHLNSVPGVIDTSFVELKSKHGGLYSSYVYDVTANLSNDGRYLVIPQNAVAEVLYPDDDITGVIK